MEAIISINVNPDSRSMFLEHGFIIAIIFKSPQWTARNPLTPTLSLREREFVERSPDLPILKGTR